MRKYTEHQAGLVSEMLYDASKTRRTEYEKFQTENRCEEHRLLEEKILSLAKLLHEAESQAKPFRQEESDRFYAFTDKIHAEVKKAKNRVLLGDADPFAEEKALLEFPVE